MTAMAGTRTDAFVMVLLGSQALAAVAIAILMPVEGSEDSVVARLSVIAFVVGMTLLAVVGLVLLRGQQGHPMGRLMLVVGTVAVWSRLVLGYCALAVQDQLPIPLALAWTTNWVWIPAQVGAFLFLLRFPTGRLAHPRWRWAEALVVSWGVVALLVTAFLPGPLGASIVDHLDNPVGIDALTGHLDGILGPLFAAIPVLATLSAAGLVWRWRHSDSEVRQQIRWVVVATITLALCTPFAALGDLQNLVLAMTYVLLPLVICLSVLRYALWDLGLIVRRTAVYVFASAVLGVLYFTATAMIDSRATPVVAAAVVALFALPVRDVVRQGLERVVFEDRGDPYVVVSALTNRLDGDDESSLHMVVTRLSETLRIPRVVVEDAEGRVLAAAGEPTSEGLRLPLHAGGEVVGWLVAHTRPTSEPFNPRDTTFLARVAAHTGWVVDAIRLKKQLEDSYTKLAAARLDERARIQRDLHDGLGPALGGISMKAEAARNLIASDATPERLTAVLGQIETDIGAAVEDVRRLIDDLQPSILERSGLHRALAVAVQDLSGPLRIHLDIAVDIPDLDLSTKVAAYRICVEALRNVTRHAGATRATVRVARQREGLEIEVSDDGRGIGLACAGVGIRSMRARAESLSGTFAIADGDGGGTSVTAVLPMAYI